MHLDTDNRYELLKGKDEIEISCFLCDIAKHEMVGAKNHSVL